MNKILNYKYKNKMLFIPWVRFRAAFSQRFYLCEPNRKKYPFIFNVKLFFYQSACLARLMLCTRKQTLQYFDWPVNVSINKRGSAKLVDRLFHSTKRFVSFHGLRTTQDDNYGSFYRESFDKINRSRYRCDRR